jgi:hypothetical protein
MCEKEDVTVLDAEQENHEAGFGGGCCLGAVLGIFGTVAVLWLNALAQSSPAGYDSEPSRDDSHREVGIAGYDNVSFVAENYPSLNCMVLDALRDDKVTFAEWGKISAAKDDEDRKQRANRLRERIAKNKGADK